MTPRYVRTLRIGALVIAALSASCDQLLTPPAKAPAQLRVALSSVHAAASLGEAFDVADNATVTVTLPGESPIQQNFTFQPGQPEIRLRVEVPVQEEGVVAQVEFALKRSTDILFAGNTSVALTPGETTEAEVPVLPVASRLETATTISVTALQQPVQLHAAAVFATGDTIPNASLTWSTTETDITVTPDGTLTAAQNGTYQVRVSMGTLSSVTNVTVASPPASVVFTTTPGATAFPGDPYPVAVSVLVKDVNGVPLRGVSVAFAADSNGVTTPATAVTNASGVATLQSWTLGGRGLNTLTATVAGLPPATFSVTTTTPCNKPPKPIAIGQTIAGQLDTRRSCASGDNYTITLTNPTILTAEITSSQMAPNVFIFNSATSVQLIGRAAGGTGTVPSETLLQPGTYTIRTGQAFPATGAAYSITVGQAAQPQSGCRGSAPLVNGTFPSTYATIGATASGSITASDCAETRLPDAGTVTRRMDAYTFFLQGGVGITGTATVTVTADFPYRFQMWQGNNGGTSLIQTLTGPAGQSQTFTYTADGSAFRSFIIMADQQGGGGNYTMTFNVQ